MHKIRAAERRLIRQGARRHRAKSDAVQEDAQEEGEPGIGVFQFFCCWFLSTRSCSAASFCFGLFGRLCDEITGTGTEDYPGYMSYPALVLGASAGFSFLGFAAPENAYTAPQTYTMICCVGALCGSIIFDQLGSLDAEVHSISPEEVSYLCIAIMLCSFLVYTIDFKWDMDITRLCFCMIAVVMMFWVTVLLQLLPSQWVLVNAALFANFTLAIAIVEYFADQWRLCVPTLRTLFPPSMLGCAVQSLGFVAIATYYSSWQTRLFSTSWMSFAWLLFAGVPLVAITMAGQFIYYICVAGLGLPRDGLPLMIGKFTAGCWTIVYLLVRFGYPMSRKWHEVFGA